MRLLLRKTTKYSGRLFPKYSLGTLCYLERNGDVLVVSKRISADSDIETVNLPGGKVEYGETPSSCAIRELREETGLTALRVNLKGIVTVAGAQLYGLRQGSWCLFLYEVATWSGNLAPENGCTATWEDKILVPSLLPNQADRHIFEFLGKPHKFEGRVDYRCKPPLIEF